MDIKVLLTLLIFEKIISKQSIYLSDKTTNMQISKMQNEFTGHWLWYSTTPKVTIHLTEISQLIS